MGNYTRFGAHVFDWAPLKARSPEARWCWITLYMSAPAKRLVPGLWHGGVSTVAECGHLSAQQANDGIHELVEARMVAEHRPTRVLRLTVLPDDAERPANGKMILSWWTRFRSVPQSVVRDQHVHLLWWLLTAFEKPTQNHLEAWQRTFGTLVIPDREDVSIATLAHQQSLFPEKSKVSSGLTDGNGIGYGMGYRFNSNDYAAPETVSDTVMYTVSGISGSGSGSDREGIGEGRRPRRDALTPVDMVTAIAAGSRGRFPTAVDARLLGDLELVARNLAESECTLADLATVGEWLGAGAMDWKQDLGARWAAQPGTLSEAVHHARLWNDQGRPDPTGRRTSTGKNGRAAAPAAPAPAASFGQGGRRRLT